MAPKKAREEFEACLITGSADGYVKDDWIPLDDHLQATFFAVRHDLPDVKKASWMVSLKTLKGYARAEGKPRQGHLNTYWKFRLKGPQPMAVTDNGANTPPSGEPADAAGSKRSRQSELASPPSASKRPASSAAGALSQLQDEPEHACSQSTPAAAVGQAVADDSPSRATSSLPDASQTGHAAEPMEVDYILTDVGDKKVLITALPQLAHVKIKIHLHNVVSEAQEIQAAFGGPEKAELFQDISFADLDDALSGRRIWCFAGHGDLELDGTPTLAFTKGGELDSVKVETIASAVRKHARHGCLELVVFTGCRTLKLAEALQEQAEVPFIVCWASVLRDDAGRIFGSAFAAASAARLGHRAAFEKAQAAVRAQTEEGYATNGLPAQVQKFELGVDPKDATRVDQATGRLKLEAHLTLQHQGRLAVGVPELLDRSARRDADVPAEAQRLLDACESCVTCEDDEAMAIEVQRAVDLLAPEPPASDAQPTALSLTGKERVGKSVFAAQVVGSARVRRHFREGRILWKVGTQPADIVFSSVATELHTLLKAQWGDRDAPNSDLQSAEAAISWIGRRLRAGAPSHMRCLLVLDGVTDSAAGGDLVKWAQSGGMDVLLTTRLAPPVNTRELVVKPTWKHSPLALFARCAPRSLPRRPHDANTRRSHDANAHL